MILLLAILAAAIAYPATAVEQRKAQLPGETLAGAAASVPGWFVSWGDRLRRWNSRTLESTVVAEGPFGEGGCLTQRGGAFVTVAGRGLGRLVAIHMASGSIEEIDTEVEMHDCVEATLFGRSGFLMIHRGMQVRFYQRGPDGWKSRDIYSIYTPSYQTGLALADVNRDGLIDIFCGNYWLQSPKTYEESWRLFAINTWFEDPKSASMRIAVLAPGRIAAAQAHVEPARIARFDVPADPRDQWPSTPLAPRLTLANVHGLAVSGGKLIAGEWNGPASRLLSIDSETGAAEVIAQGIPTLSIVPLGGDSFVTAGGDTIRVWRQPRRR